MHDFTPISALIGGALIGLASVWLLAANGRIAGVSSILHGLTSPPDAQEGLHDAQWRAWFISGLLLAGLAWQAAGAPVPLRESLPLGWVAAAGLLVGLGTRLGSGCTSGHGVCGLGRLSTRSLVAVIVFMVSGMGAAYLMRQVLGVAS
ncbi:MAG: YeeE/YedE family protein [Betaproteobacteria bacterium]|nr:YeeE/YedE family protein [Betaproteobacteria bacterium]